MKHLLLALVVLLSFTGCDDKEEQAKAAAKEKAQEARSVELAEFEAQKIALKKAQEAQKVLEAEKEILAEKARVAQEALDAKIAEEKIAQAKVKEASTAKEATTPLNAMGIEMGKGTFSIDTTKTKVFIDELKAKVDTKIKTMGDDLEKGILQSKEAGIDINEKHIHIDLNKTQDILKNWGQKIQTFVNDFDNPRTENNKTNKGN